MWKKSGKRGLSDVVTTLIIILLSLVAIGIVWVVVQNLLSEGAEGVDISQFTVDIDFVSASINGNEVTMTVRRTAGQGNMTGLKFILSDGLNSEEFSEEGGLNALQMKTFTVTTTLNPSNLEVAEVAPVYRSSGGEDVAGQVTDTYNFGSGGGSGGEENGENGEGEGEACDPACGPGETCNNGMCVPEGCTEPRTDTQVCNDLSAVCGIVQDVCGDFVDCSVVIGGCTELEECVSNQCQLLTAISGTVNSTWPEEISIYFDSYDLPTTESYSGRYAKFLPPSQESECLFVEDYLITQTTPQKVLIKLQATQTDVAAGDSVELWATFESCMA